MLNTTKLLGQSLFLDFKGPDFMLGQPAPTFEENRYVLWESDYPVELALYEMLVWIRDNRMNIYSGGPVSIEQHTYSRGFITERIMADFWQGLSRCLNTSSKSIKFDEFELISKLSSRGIGQTQNPTYFNDHTVQFLDSIHNLNEFTRNLSIDYRSGVKDIYRQIFSQGKELVDWWTTLIRDLDMVEDIHNIGNRREVPWSDVISSVVGKEAELADAIGDSEKVEFSDKATRSWMKLKPVLKYAEKIESFLPFKNIQKETFSVNSLAELSVKMDFRKETVHVDFKASGKKRALIFIAPRYFRGYRTEELVVIHILFPLPFYF